MLCLNNDAFHGRGGDSKPLAPHVTSEDLTMQRAALWHEKSLKSPIAIEIVNVHLYARIFKMELDEIKVHQEKKKTMMKKTQYYDHGSDRVFSTMYKHAQCVT